MLDPAKPFSARPSAQAHPAAAVKADLTGLLDRARDERFRLLKMLKDARAEVAVTLDPSASVTADKQETPASALPAPPAQFQALLDKLAALDAKLDAKLHRLTQHTDAKLDRMEQLDRRITMLTERLAGQAADGHAVRRDLAAALGRAAPLSTQVGEQLERFDAHLEAYGRDAAEAFARQAADRQGQLLADLDAALVSRRSGLDDALAESYAAAEHELTARFNGLAETLERKAQDLLARTEATADAALTRVRKQVVEAMARSHETSEAFRDQLGRHREAHREHLTEIADTADAELQLHAQRLDETMTGLAELFDGQADAILADLQDRATALLDQMAAQVQRLSDRDEPHDPSRGDDQRHAA
ncbi:MAG: hypothetical protein AAGG38_14010 [Planctomycetota bacterium]